VHLVNRDFVSLSRLYVRLGFIPPDTDLEPIQTALADALPDVLGASVDTFNIKNVIGDTRLPHSVHKHPRGGPEKSLFATLCAPRFTSLPPSVARPLTDAPPSRGARRHHVQVPLLAPALLHRHRTVPRRPRGAGHRGRRPLQDHQRRLPVHRGSRAHGPAAAGPPPQPCAPLLYVFGRRLVVNRTPLCRTRWSTW
jgi:hypothetical protein